MGAHRSDLDKIVESAIAGKDILFGESHDMTAMTMGVICKVIQRVPSDRIQAVSLELPVNMLPIFEKGAAERLGFEGFVRKAFELEIASMQESSLELATSQKISDAQSLWIQEFLENYASTPISVLIANSVLPDMYDLALNASKHNISVVPSDVRRHRVVASILNSDIAPKGIRIDNDLFSEIFSSELDDHSDVRFLEEQGFDFDSPKIVIVHRGYNHLDDTMMYSGTTVGSGFDDVLEANGRSTMTVDMTSKNYDSFKEFTSDPLDLSYRQKIDTGACRI